MASCLCFHVHGSCITNSRMWKISSRDLIYHDELAYEPKWKHQNRSNIQSDFCILKCGAEQPFWVLCFRFRAHTRKKHSKAVWNIYHLIYNKQFLATKSKKPLSLKPLSLHGQLKDIFMLDDWNQRRKVFFWLNFYRVIFELVDASITI